MDFDKLINNITPEIYQNLQRAIEIGKWPDGTPLTQEQKELSMQAVIAYDNKFVSEQERVGYIDRGHKAEGESCGDKPKDEDPSPLKWS
jgi:uncharacterized protein YeaC (DUF1315 family)